MAVARAQTRHDVLPCLAPRHGTIPGACPRRRQLARAEAVPVTHAAAVPFTHAHARLEVARVALVRLGALRDLGGIMRHTPVVDQGHGGAVVRVRVDVGVCVGLDVCVVNLRQEPSRRRTLRKGRLKLARRCPCEGWWRLGPGGERMVIREV